MTRAYIFIYGEELGTREEVRDFLEQIPEIIFWRYDVPHVFYVTSEYSASLLAEKLFALTNPRLRLGLFAFFEYTPNAQGRLTPETWRLLNTKIPPNSNSAGFMSALAGLMKDAS